MGGVLSKGEDRPPVTVLAASVPSPCQFNFEMGLR